MNKFKIFDTKLERHLNVYEVRDMITFNTLSDNLKEISLKNKGNESFDSCFTFTMVEFNN